MACLINIVPSKGKFADLRLMDGTSLKRSYAIVARRGDVFLGVKFSGLAEGKQLVCLRRPTSTFSCAVLVTRAWQRS